MSFGTNYTCEQRRAQIADPGIASSILAVLKFRGE